MKVVFDSNIFISALVLPGGRADQALSRIWDGEDNLLLSRPLIDETISVLARKFSRDREQLSRVAVMLSDLGELVETAERITVLTDEPDNRILECAAAGGAQCIVTGDKAMLALGEYRGIRIMSLSDYLAL